MSVLPTGATAAAASTVIPPLAQAYIDSPAVVYMDNGRIPRTPHDYGYTRKIGVVEHISGGGTLSGMTAFFRGEQAQQPQGSAHFGTGRDLWGHLPYAGVWIPVAETHQYMPIRRNSDYPNGCSPWAQGAILINPGCPISPSPTIRGMRSGETNGAFHSCENVGWDGSNGLTDPQFNANALLRAYLAGLDGYDINPATQLWHSQIDQMTRCEDPGWGYGLEAELQAAAKMILYEDSPHLLRALEPIAGQSPTPPSPPPAPVGLSQDAKDAFEQIALWANLGRDERETWQKALEQTRLWAGNVEAAQGGR